MITSQHLLYGFTFRRDVLLLSCAGGPASAFFLTDEMFPGGAEREGAQRALSIPLYALIAALSSICSGTWRPCSALLPASTSEGLDKMGLDFAIVATFIAATLPAREPADDGGGHPGERRTALSPPLLAEIHIIVSALAGMVVGCAASDKEVIMGWLMIGAAGPDHFLQPFCFFSRLTCHQPGPRWGFPQLLGPVGADRHLAAHCSAMSPATGWTGDPRPGRHLLVTVLTRCACPPWWWCRVVGMGLLSAALAGEWSVLALVKGVP